MKTSLLFLTALVAIPVYAGNLNLDDWALDTTWGGQYAVDEDGTLSLENVALTYTPDTFKMQDGTSLSITLTFDPSTVGSAIIGFSPYSTGLSGITNAFAQINSGYIALQQMINGNGTTLGGQSLNLSGAPKESTLVLNYFVEDGYLWFNYVLNDKECMFDGDAPSLKLDVNTELNWKPFLGAMGTTFKVTEMTLTPAPSPSVPEPTTATLSLLALAALAARRRRASH